jgi:Helicase associated domain
MLKEFEEEHDHARVPQDYILDGKKLGGAVATMRSSHKRGSLSPEHEAQLLTPKGWVWDAIEAQWLDHYVEVKRYGDEHGHLRGMDKQHDGWMRKMKNRAGVIGQQGLGPLLANLAGPSGASLILCELAGSAAASYCGCQPRPAAHCVMMNTLL